MIAVFMGDQDRVELIDIFTDRREPLSNLKTADSGIDEYPRAICRDERAVARTA